MAKKSTPKLDALIFIDTNILLDFYRIRSSDISLKYLAEIEKHKDILILTNQVEMEFRKNRQSVILEAFGEANKSTSSGVSVPTVLIDAKPAAMIKKAQAKISEQQKRLKQRLEKILTNPTTYDKVYQTLLRVFKSESEFNLNRKNDKKQAIRDLAQKRFILGYPPRKKNDNSIGDALNWEWIIDCALRSDKHIIIVTRDTDFGIVHSSNMYLNDWLQFEFRDRVSQKRKIKITNKLSDAFKWVEIPVTEAMIEEEKNIISKWTVNPQLLEPMRTQNYTNAIDDLRQAAAQFSENINAKNYDGSLDKLKQAATKLAQVIAEKWGIQIE